MAVTPGYRPGATRPLIGWTYPFAEPLSLPTGASRDRGSREVPTESGRSALGELGGDQPLVLDLLLLRVHRSQLGVELGGLRVVGRGGGELRVQLLLVGVQLEHPPLEPRRLLLRGPGVGRRQRRSARG